MADRANASQGRGWQGVQGNALDGRRDESRVRQVQVIVTFRHELLGRCRRYHGELARQGVFVQEVVPRESRGKGYRGCHQLLLQGPRCPGREGLALHDCHGRVKTLSP